MTAMPDSPNGFNAASPIFQLVELPISPALATNILETKAPNRNVSEARVEAYASDMRVGRWLRNGETIKFDRFGRLLDGQHRLWAVVMADVTVTFVVALGVAPEAMPTVDTGRPRRFADVLQIAGNTRGQDISSTVNLIWRYESGVWSRGGSPSHLLLGGILSRFADLPDWLSSHNELARLGRRIVVNWATYLAGRGAAAEVAAFRRGLATGENLVAGDPILVYRETLLRWQSDPRYRHSSGRDFQRFTAGITIKALNAHLDGRSVRALKLLPSEAFPRFQPPVPGLHEPARH